MSGAPAGPRPRVLVVTSTYPRWRGDAEPGFVHELAARLATRFDVRVLCPRAPGAAATEELDGVRVVRFRYAPARLETLVSGGGVLENLRRHRWKWLLLPGFLAGQAWALRRELRAWRPDLVHAHWLVPQGVVALLAQAGLSRRVPVLATSHGADLYALRGRLATACKAFVARRAAALTVVSRALRDEAASLGVRPGQVHVQPMGVDLQSRFTPAAVARSMHELLFVGRLVEKKGLRDLIDALPAIVADEPRVTLTVAGFGPDEAACRERAAQLGLADRVRFLGPVAQADLPALYRRAALLVAPFRRAASGDQDGLGLVVVEAMGCACPVLVSAIPAARDTVAHGETGWLAEPGSPEHLAAQVRHLLAHPQLRAQLGAAGRGAALAFDWAAVAEGYAALIDRLRRRPERA